MRIVEQAMKRVHFKLVSSLRICWGTMKFWRIEMARTCYWVTFRDSGIWFKIDNWPRALMVQQSWFAKCYK